MNSHLIVSIRAALAVATLAAPQTRGSPLRVLPVWSYYAVVYLAIVVLKSKSGLKCVFRHIVG